MRHLEFKSTIAIILLLLIGCSAPTQESSEHREQAMTIVLSRDNDVLPLADCARKEVATQMALFFDAFNRGDEEVMAQFFGDDFDFFGGLPLYAEPDGESNLIESSDLVLPELIQWHQKGERMYLERIQILYSPGYPPEILSFNYLLARENLNTSRQIRYYESKGQLFCDSEGVRLLKWSSGRYVFDRHSNCYKPEDDLVESEVVIACG